MRAVSIAGVVGRDRLRRMLPVALFAVWLPIVMGGLVALWNYSNTPGDPGNPAMRWPIASQLSPPSSDAMTLVMVVHPQCPCSRASIGELAELMAHMKGQLRAWVLFVRPHDFAENWAESDLWQSARAIPGVHTLIDDDGREARRFGAATSGETLLYDSGGHLLYAGGVTAARGHFGDNAGITAIFERIDNAHAHRFGSAAVYGCPLFASSKNGSGVVACKR
ncbi:MAG TPA: hypothetical protein VKR29_07240 [Candidatus Binataceae bacterium]|nr:hypothetical protein [Candidatus Binataceae bacterium]